MVPQYKDMMFPILKFLGKNTKARLQEVYDETYKFLTEDFKCESNELKRVVTNGKFVYEDRAGWALTYLTILKTFKQNNQDKNLVKRVERGIYEITEYGKKILLDKDARNKFENWYDEIYKNKDTCKTLKNKTSTSKNKEESNYTPIEIIEQATGELNENLKSQILDEISQKDPNFFEYLVSKLLEKMGYGVGRLTKSGADGGIDGIINEDELGLSQIYIQAKSWQGSVSRPEIQKFVGAISDKQTKKGVFITTSNFTKEAREYAKNVQSHTVILVDGDRLAELMIKYKIGVQVRQILEICDIDGDFFGY
ncbi:restriction endonuclease [Campylobacter gastrosuis]|uniref:Restriction endonuclease n=1 Tax=Campylobacter gastrosuis TaxID=2974576 RepID=A0ABT7HRL9_9BACT|nr:restriction endonuclease [Campylobacter gastrosuis]MDL0089484.1 restriction endonuclease [Campylobacter gastrosuis]